jgi:thiol-disulfide isomerase/thioredoxin
MTTRRALLTALPLALLATPARSGTLVPSEPHPVDLALFDRGDHVLPLAAVLGRVTLLHFWASWCGPCRTELPDLDALQRDTARDGLKVAAVSLDLKGWPAIDATAAALGLRSLAFYHDRDRAAARGLGIIGLPTTLVLDAKRREVGRVIGAGDWASPDLRRRVLALAS